MTVPALYVLKPEINHLVLRHQTTLINSKGNHSLIYDIILSNTLPSCISTPSLKQYIQRQKVTPLQRPSRWFCLQWEAML